MPALDLILAALAIPLLALRVVVSGREIRENLGFIALVIGATMASYVAMVRFNVESPSIVGGVCGLAASVWLARHGIGLAPTETAPRAEKIARASLLKATFPLWATVLILIITRLDTLRLKAWLTASSPALNLPLGALGSFFSGSNTVSNLTFGGIQNATAATLGLSRTTILSLQSAGGAMGNMVCIHNIVAVCSILGLHNEEGRILRQTFWPLLLYGVIAGAVSLLL